MLRELLKYMLSDMGIFYSILFYSILFYSILYFLRLQYLKQI